MGSWSAISKSELEALISKQLLACTPEQQQLFERIRVPIVSVTVEGADSPDTFFVVAKHGDIVVYYQDIEEGFNLPSLTPSGALSSLGYEQWELTHVLCRLAA